CRAGEHRAGGGAEQEAGPEQLAHGGGRVAERRPVVRRRQEDGEVGRLVGRFEHVADDLADGLGGVGVLRGRTRMGGHAVVSSGSGPGTSVSGTTVASPPSIRQCASTVPNSGISNSARTSRYVNLPGST